MDYPEFEKGLNYFTAAFPNLSFPEKTIAAWWLTVRQLSADEYEYAIAKIISENKTWYPSGNFGGAVMEIMRNTARFQPGYGEPQGDTPKQIPPPREESKSLVAFHYFAMARFEAMRAGELPRNPGESVRDHCSRMQAKILSECRINGNPAPRQYAEAWA